MERSAPVRSSSTTPVGYVVLSTSTTICALAEEPLTERMPGSVIVTLLPDTDRLEGDAIVFPAAFRTETPFVLYTTDAAALLSIDAPPPIAEIAVNSAPFDAIVKSGAVPFV